MSVPPAAGALDALLRRDRLLVLAGITGVTLLAWLWLAPMALDMKGAMDGPARWMMDARWDLSYALLMLAMWAAMMIGMMLPSAAPTLLLYAAVVRRSAQPPAGSARCVSAFALGYVFAWTAYSLAATALQWQLARAVLLTPMMASAVPRFSGALLILAGAFQLSPWKRACLGACRAPAAFIAQHWRPGAKGALRMGLAHGALCVGCCWALMLLLFVGGVMSLGWIAALSAFVLIEKLLPLGERGGRLAGCALVAAGVWLLAVG